jgi:hypothetical protein
MMSRYSNMGTGKNMLMGDNSGPLEEHQGQLAARAYSLGQKVTSPQPRISIKKYHCGQQIYVRERDESSERGMI